MVKKKTETKKKITKKKKEHPLKGLRKSKGNQGFFSILFFLVMLYIAILGSIIKVLSNLSLDKKIEIATYSSGLILGYFLLGLGIFIGLYLILIIFIGAFEISNHNKLFSSNVLKARKTLREIVFNSTWTITINSFLLSAYLVLLSFIYFETKYALIIMYLFIGYSFWNFTLILFMKNSFKSLIKSYLIKWKHSGRNCIHLAYSLILILIIITSIFMIVICETSNYSINLDKERYFIGEDVYVEVFPEGLTKPYTLNITYSNEHFPLEYIIHEDFLRAPIYLKIPSDILKPEPYNSLLIIEYELNYFDEFLRKNTQKFFIPVFNESIKTENNLINQTL